jgi:ADP-ribose pyrophosphatase YjhB (NUDIX family)
MNVTQPSEDGRHLYVTTNVIIENDEKELCNQKIILITRRNPPYGLAIPGGFADLGMSLEENAIKIAKEETGLDIILENPTHPFYVRSNLEENPSGHIISVVYVAKGYSGTLKAGDDALEAHLYTTRKEVKDFINNRQLAFDHGEILTKYVDWKFMSELERQESLNYVRFRKDW